jgi:hypothetical protein
MTERNRTVIGLFEDYDHAAAAVDELEASGFSHDQFNVLGQEYVIKEKLEEEQVEGALKDAVNGAIGGTAIGGLLGLLVGVGSLAIPGIGPVIAAGSITSTLAAMAAGGATVGAVAGSLANGIAGHGLSEADAAHYAEHLKQGGLLVIIHTDEFQAPFVSTILEKHDSISQTTAVYDPEALDRLSAQ